MGSGRSENVVFSRTTPTSLYVVSDPRFAHFCNTILAQVIGPSGE